MIDEKVASRLRLICPSVYASVAGEKPPATFIVYQHLETEPSDDMDGGVPTEGFVTYQVTIFSDSYANARAMAKQTRDSLGDWHDSTVAASMWTNEHMMADASAPNITTHMALQWFRFYADWS